jgi:hypothetical protein
MGFTVSRDVAAAGGNDMLRKPIVLEHLFDAIAGLMSEKEDAAALAVA